MKSVTNSRFSQKRIDSSEDDIDCVILDELAAKVPNLVLDKSLMCCTSIMGNKHGKSRSVKDGSIKSPPIVTKKRSSKSCSQSITPKVRKIAEKLQLEPQFLSNLKLLHLRVLQDQPQVILSRINMGTSSSKSVPSDKTKNKSSPCKNLNNNGEVSKKERVVGCFGKKGKDGAKAYKRIISFEEKKKRKSSSFDKASKSSHGSLQPQLDIPQKFISQDNEKGLPKFGSRKRKNSESQGCPVKKKLTVMSDHSDSSLLSPVKNVHDISNDLSTLGFLDEHSENENEETNAIRSGICEEESKTNLVTNNHFNVPMQQYFNKKIAAKEIEPEKEHELKNSDVCCKNLEEDNSELVQNTSSCRSDPSLFDEDSADSFCNGIFSSDIDISQRKINFIPKINSTPKKSLEIKSDPKETERLLKETSKIFESRTKTSKLSSSKSVSKSGPKKSPPKSSPSEEPVLSDLGSIDLEKVSSRDPRIQKRLANTQSSPIRVPPKSSVKKTVQSPSQDIVKKSVFNRLEHPRNTSPGNNRSISPTKSLGDDADDVLDICLNESLFEDDLFESPKRSPNTSPKRVSDRLPSNKLKERTPKKNDTSVNQRKSTKCSNSTNLSCTPALNPFQDTRKIPSLFDLNIKASSIFAQKSLVDSAYEQQPQQDVIRPKFRQKQLPVEQTESRVDKPQPSKDVEDWKNLSFGTSVILLDDDPESVNTSGRPARFNRVSHYTNGHSNSVNNTNRKSENEFSSIVGEDRESSAAIESNFFKRYCYAMLKWGNCNYSVGCCSYGHQTAMLETMIQKKTFASVMAILDITIAQNYFYFLKQVWKKVVMRFGIDSYGLLKKLYNANFHRNFVLKEFIECRVETRQETAQGLLKKLATDIIDKTDKASVDAICVSIKRHLLNGYYWESIKWICSDVSPPRDLMEIVLMECSRRNKKAPHIQEVFEVVRDKMTPDERRSIDSTIYTDFLNVAERNRIDTKSIKMLPTPANLENGVNNNNQSYIPNKTCVDPDIRANGRNKELNRRSSIFHQATLDNSDSPLSEGSLTRLDEGVASKDVSYNLMEVESERPTADKRERSQSKKQFRKFYANTMEIDMALNCLDYDQAWELLDEFVKENTDAELLQRAFFQIICKNVRSSKRHFEEIMNRAVQSSYASELNPILFEVGVNVLIDLVDHELYVESMQLLKLIQTLPQARLHKPTVAYVLISAEIFLVNKKPRKALYMLKKHGLIRTDPDEWLVDDNEDADLPIRNKLIVLLFKSLMWTDHAIAINLLEFLMFDQYSPYYPVDLSLFIDEMALLLVLKNDFESLENLCRLVMDRDLTFRRYTYQELITYVLPRDDVLANQLFLYATFLGCYPKIKINQSTQVIIDVNWTEEEIYLVLKMLFNNFSKELGPAIEHLRPGALKVTLVLEDIPPDERLYKNNFEISVEEKFEIRHKFDHCKHLLKEVLQTRFRPSIAFSKYQNHRFCRIISRDLVNYLKNWT